MKVYVLISKEYGDDFVYEHVEAVLTDSATARRCLVILNEYRYGGYELQEAELDRLPDGVSVDNQLLIASRE